MDDRLTRRNLATTRPNETRLSTATLPPPAPAGHQGTFSRVADRLFGLACRGAGLAMIGLVLALVVLLTEQAWPVLSRAGHYEVFTSSNWDPEGKTAGHPI